jgi:superfamily I DNA/RNA helicase
VTPRTDLEQERVLASGAAHLVVVAPPGTGKTSLAARLAARDAARLGPYQQVLVLTFSNQARGQLEREIADHVPAHLRSRVVVTNYHQFFWLLVRQYRRALGLPDDFRMTSGAKRRAIVRGSSRNARLLPPNFGTEEVAELRYPQLRPHLAMTDEQLEPILQAVEREHGAGRLVFGDFGALFMKLVLGNPTVLRALQARFVSVIADEHQDASAVQDYLVRAVGRTRVVFADPMQLIHAWRGADIARLNRHLAECDDQIELRTPHRWHADATTGQWLLDVRARLAGEARPGHRPPRVNVTLTDPARGRRAMLPEVKYAISRAMRSSAKTVAVMAFTNADVESIRSYLCRNGMFPAQLGLSHAFDRLVDLPEELSGMTPRGAAERLIRTLRELVPGLDDDPFTQALARLEDGGTRKTGSGNIAKILLSAADFAYENGPAGFFPGVVHGLDELSLHGHHAPAFEEARLYRRAASQATLDDQLPVFQQALAAASHMAARSDHGVLTMTVHQSKGREFDAVVLVGATADVFDPADHERRRLFYVAITRARTSWEIIAPRGNETPLLAALGNP